MRTITFVFADYKIGTEYVGFRRPSGDRIYIKVTISINETGDNVEYLAKDKKLYLSNFGKIKLSNDIEKNSIVPARYNIAIKDIRSNIQSAGDTLKYLLYEYGDKVNKSFFVQIFIKYKDATSYIEEFSGYAVIDTINYNPYTREHTAEVLPKTDLLNNTAIFRNGWDATRFTYGETTTYPKNPLNLGFSKPAKAIIWDWQYLSRNIGAEKGLIQKIFEFVEPNVEVEVKNFMRFYDKDNIINVGFEDLILDNNWIGSIFAEDKHQSIKTLGDLLRAIAFEFMSIAGFITQTKAFFRPILYNDNNPQPMGKLLWGSNKLKYYHEPKDLRLKAILYSQDYNRQNRYVEDYNTTLEVTTNTGASKLEKELISITGSVGQVGQPPTRYIANILSQYLITYLYIYNVSGHNDTAKHTLPATIFRFYTNLYSALSTYFTRSFIFQGLQYDFNRTFVYENDVYCILNMEKDLDRGNTYIEALRVINNEYIPPTTFFEEPKEPIQVEALYSYGATAEFTYESFVAEGYDYYVGSISKNEILDSIEWAITQEFEADKIDTLMIYEKASQNILLTQDQVDFSALNVTTMKFLKKYDNDEIFVLRLIPKTGQTLTQGKGHIVLKKLRREF